MKHRFLFADADMFFVSVELAMQPSMRGLPVVVGGSSGRGVITAASYEARKFGIHAGMSGYRAHQLCPNGIFLKGNYRAYSSYSDRMFSIFRQFSPDVHVRSIDEGFAEISSCLSLFGGEEQLALQLKDAIFEQLGITVSIGIASTITLAKICLEDGKPDGLTIVPDGGQRDYLQELPIGRIPGIGPKTKLYFTKKGILRIGDLYRYTTKEELIQQVGSYGLSLWNLLQGVSTYNEASVHERKSISNENTFYEALTDRNAIEKEVMRLSEKVGFRLRKQGLKAKTIAVKIRYKNFTTITRRTTVQKYVEMDKDIFQEAWRLLQKELRSPVRLIGVGLSSFMDNEDLFSSLYEKDRKLHKAVDFVREKYGRKTIFHAR
jgi:DNA polymerase IV